uniref:Uncharacterized protein n=1 Tax=Oryza punctata TaxID=4537 RepID=A0A0E0LYF3_ORYPU
MLEVDEEDPERLTMTSADDKSVDAQTAMKTTKAAKLQSRRTQQLQLCQCSGEKSNDTEAMHCDPRWWVVLAYIIVVSCGTAALARACAVEECH